MWCVTPALMGFASLVKAPSRLTREGLDGVILLTSMLSYETQGSSLNLATAHHSRSDRPLVLQRQFVG